MGIFASLIYIIVSFLSGGVLVLLSIDRIGPADLDALLSLIETTPNVRVITGLLGLLVILVCIRTIQTLIIKTQREKTIAFEGNYGQVSISLAAVEDMIKKLLLDFKELKDVKPQVTASKKGLQVVLRVVLTSYTSIPEFTAKVQEVVRSKLQNMLGLEEEMSVRVEIKKILCPETKMKKKEEVDDSEPSVPYREYKT
ncbi:alkaline shock response membrane anchor protein AmaP [Candidatus Omnitrophota bacterium]